MVAGQRTRGANAPDAVTESIPEQVALATAPAVRAAAVASPLGSSGALAANTDTEPVLVRGPDTGPLLSSAAPSSRARRFRPPHRHLPRSRASAPPVPRLI